MSDRTPAQEGQTLAALQAIMTERQRQHEKWGVQRIDWPVWLTVLSEEVGELAQEMLHFREVEAVLTKSELETWQEGVVRAEWIPDRLRAMRAEAIQVAAVAVSIIEHLDERIGELDK